MTDDDIDELWHKYDIGDDRNLHSVRLMIREAVQKGVAELEAALRMVDQLNTQLERYADRRKK